MPALRRVELSAFKGVRSAFLELVPGCTVLIGPNNTGKSTWMHALQVPRLFFQLPVCDQLANTDPVRYLEELVSRGSTASTIRLTLAISSEKQKRLVEHYAFMRAYQNRHFDSLGAPREISEFPDEFVVEFQIAADRDFDEVLRLSRLAISLEGDCVTEVLDRPIPWQGGDYARVVSAAEVGLEAAMPDARSERKREDRLVKLPPSGWLLSKRAREELKDDSYYADEMASYARQLSVLPAHRRYHREDSLAGTGEVVESDGTVLLGRILHRLRTDASDAFEELEHRVRTVLPEVEELHVFTGGRPMAEMRISEESSGRATEAIPGGQMGAATQHVVTMIAMALEQPEESLLMIEEPEICIHPGAQRRLMAELIELAKQRRFQLLLSTQAAGFIGRASLTTAVCRAYRAGSELLVRQVDHEAIEALILDLGLEPADAIFADTVLVVEGETEEAFYHAFLSVPGSPVYGHTTRIVSLAGSGGIKKPLVSLDTALDGRIQRLLMLDRLGLQDSLPDLLGWHVTLWDKDDGSPGEFEDQFTASELAQALRTMVSESGVAVELSNKLVHDTLSNQATRTSRTLKRLARERAGDSFEWDGRVWGRALADVLIRRERGVDWSHRAVRGLCEAESGKSGRNEAAT